MKFKYNDIVVVNEGFYEGLKVKVVRNAGTSCIGGTIVQRYGVVEINAEPFNEVLTFFESSLDMAPDDWEP